MTTRPCPGFHGQRPEARRGISGAEAKKYRIIKRIEASAIEIFLDRGYDGATMDAVAELGSMSKATLYTHFPSKCALFEHVLNSICVVTGDAIGAGQFDGTKISLVEVGVHLLRGFASPRSIALARVVIGAFPRYPQFGAILYRRVICSYQAVFVKVMRHLHATGQVNAPNAEEAANAFLTLLVGDFFLRRIFGADDVDTEEQVVAKAVSTFMSKYSV